jgi:2-keto-4-pentenoate hydratase
MLKTAIHPDGVGVVAPIYVLGHSGDFRLPQANAVGVEVEVGVVLARDVPSGADEATVIAAIDHYFTGVEICGSRYVDRSLAGLLGGHADNMSALAYCLSRSSRRAGGDIAGTEIEVSFAGAQVYMGIAKHAFGTVLASVVAYARTQRPEYPLTAGSIITTGSMCGLVATSGPGHVVARLADETIEFDIV